MPTPLERFTSKVDYDGPIPHLHPDAGPCHLWTAGRFPAGYGQFKDSGVGGYAHRWIWIHTVGPIPQGLVLDHWACEVRACVNVGHLRVVTHRENLLRSQVTQAAINRAKMVCPQGHPYDASNTYIRHSDNARVCRICQRAAIARYRSRVRARA